MASYKQLGQQENEGYSFTPAPVSNYTPNFTDALPPVGAMFSPRRTDDPRTVHSGNRLNAETSDEEDSVSEVLTKLSSRPLGPARSQYIILASVLLSLTCVAVLVGMYFEGWHFITSLYVVVQVVTTIGYGDVTVSSPGMKVFMAFNVLACLVGLAYFMNLQVSSFVEIHVSSIVNKLDSIDDQVKGYTASPARKTVTARTILFIGTVLIGTVFFRIYEHCSCSYGVSAVEGCQDTPYDFDTCEATGGYVKTWADSFYMSIITLTTVGFGDHTPRSRVGRVFGIVWMLVGVSVAAMWTEAMAKLFHEGDVEKRAADGEELTDEVFSDMDREGKGYLTRADFVCYTLVKHGIVPVEVMEKIDSDYNNFEGAAKNAVTLLELQSMSASRKSFASPL